MIYQIDFWDKFWPVFTASIISGLIFTFIIGFLISRVRKPKIKICLSIGTNFKGHCLMFYAVNTGKVGLMPNEMQWNVYFPLRIKPRDDYKKGLSVLTYNHQAYHNITGFNEKSILPGDSLRLTYIPVEVKEIKDNDENPEISDDLKEVLRKTVGDFEWIDEAKYYSSLSTIRGQKKYEKFFWDYFKKINYVEDSSFIKRPIFEISEKTL